MTRQLLTLLVALAVVSATIGLTAGAQSSEIRTVDDATKLASDSGAERFDRHGSVTGSDDSIQLEVTVAQTAGAVDVEGFHVDQTTKYIHVKYDEEIPRTVRLHIDGDVIRPRLRRGVEPIGESNATADFQVADGGDTQSVTLHLDGETDAVFAVSTVSGQIQEVRRDISSAASDGLENLTGISAPSFGSGEWQRVQPRRLSGTNVSYTIEDSESATVQYKDGDNGWLSAPECAADAPVCTVQRQNQTVIVSQSSTAPPVRYKTGQDLRARLESALNDVTSVPGDIADKLSDLLGGDD